MIHVGNLYIFPSFLPTLYPIPKIMILLFLLSFCPGAAMISRQTTSPTLTSRHFVGTTRLSSFQCGEGSDRVESFRLSNWSHQNLLNTLHLNLHLDTTHFTYSSVCLTKNEKFGIRSYNQITRMYSCLEEGVHDACGYMCLVRIWT